MVSQDSLPVVVVQRKSYQTMVLTWWGPRRNCLVVFVSLIAEKSLLPREDKTSSGNSTLPMVHTMEDSGNVWSEPYGKCSWRLIFSVSRLNDDVLNTVFCEVENVVNSRPLTKLSDDIHDDNPITPNHLLLLRGNYAYPWAVTQESDTYRRRWRHVQHLVTQFWRKWLKLYIPELQRRQKWLKPSPNIKTGDLVLIVDENSPRGSWPLGLI